MDRFVKLSTVIVALLVCVEMTFVFPCWAQGQRQDDQWSKPVRLAESGAFPTMVVDPAGRLHLMWTAWTAKGPDQQVAGWGDTLLYARLDEMGWTEPVDVLAAPAGSAADFPTLLLGTDGMLHAFWRTGSQIQHSWASPFTADSAQAWTTEGSVFYLNPNTTGYFPYAVVVDDAGVFHATYIEVAGGQWGLVYTRSQDNGYTWSTPIPVAFAPDGVFVTLPRLAVSEGGTLHVVWSWAKGGVFYARSTDGGQTWLEVVQLGGEAQGWANLIAVGKDTVHVVWNGSPPAAGRYHRWSSDGGKTWSNTTVISKSGGLTQGWPAIVADSAGIVHLFMFAGSARGDDMHYASWDGTAWSELTIISPGEAGGWTGFPSAVVRYGNELHVAWTVFHGENVAPGIWYTTKRTSAPWVPPAPILTAQATPSMAATPSLTPTASVTATPSPSPTVRLVVTEPYAQDNSNPGLPVVLGILPVVVLVAGVVLMQALRIGRR